MRTPELDRCEGISIIAAVSENGVIGRGNELPWHIPEDLKHFRELTTNHVVVMGRKTFESIGKALPDRMNIVVTHDREFSAPGCIVCHSVEDALRTGLERNSKVFIIGGGEIFQASIGHVSRLYLTVVERVFEGDARFPDYSYFRQVMEEGRGESEGLRYRFLVLER